MADVRVRFAPSPTGSLHLGGALTAVVNRRFADERGGSFLLRIDDTDASRTEPGAEAAILHDLHWLGIAWDEGPVRQSARRARYTQAARELVASRAAAEDAGTVRARTEGRPTLLRPDGTATYALASVVDDVDFGITHVIRGKDHLANEPVHAALARALGAEPPAYVHHGLLVGDDGTKLSKRRGAASVADLRERGIPAEAVRAYLEELGVPRGDVRFDSARLARLAVDALAAVSDEELARRAGVDASFGPALRGARDLAEARALAELVAARPEPAPPRAPEVLRLFVELREHAAERLGEEEARALVAALRSAGADLRAVRIALTGAARGPELWTVLHALPRDEALLRARAAADAQPGAVS